MTGYRTGAPTRRKILEALLRQEPRTIRGLAAEIEASENNTREHVRRMERYGLVLVLSRVGRRGSVVRLSDAGREAAKLL